MKVSSDPRVDKKIRSLRLKDSARIVRIVDTFETYGFALSGKYLKKLGNNLWELRSGKWRILFGVVKGRAVVVDLFYKKTQRTPNREIELALKRINEYEK